jgi:hypothetical protein
MEESKTLERRSLAKGLKVWIDILFFLVVSAGAVFATMWPIAAWAGHGSFDLTIPVSIGESSLLPIHPFELAPAIPTEGLPSGAQESRFGSLVKTRGELRFSTSAFGPALVFWASSVVLFCALAFGLLLLRRILATVVEGRPFHPSNPGRLNHLGWIILASSLILPLIQFLFGVWTLPRDQAAGIPLSASLVVQEEWVFCGLLVLLLAAIWKEAVRIAEEQSLTV